MSPTPALHPLNERFEWSASPTSGRLPAAQREQFDEQGFFLYEGAFDAADVARAIEQIDPFEKKVDS